MSVPQITVDLTPPSIGQSVEQFNAQAHIWTANLSDGFKPQANALADFVNQKAGEANDDATAAQTARTQAQTASGTASSAASTASTAATNAGNSATLASNKADEASTSATAAGNAKTAAESARDTAITKAGEASTSATAAAGSATSANTAKTAAETAATNAGNSATAAATSATTAGTAATNAGNSATAAAGSATSANTAKTAAETARDDAQTARTQAQTAATNAGTSATNAANSAAAAAQSAQDAADAAVGDILSSSTPQALGSASAGSAVKASRDDHVHAMPTATDVGAAPAAHVGSGGAAHADATASVSGFMSAAQFNKLAGIAASANNYTHPSDDGNLHVPATGTGNNGKVLKAGLTAGSLAWGTLTATDVGAAPSSHVGSGGAEHANATPSVAGFMSSVDKAKLNGVADGATANQTDAYLLNRANHTGTQAQSTVTNLTTDLAARVNRQDSYATVTSGVIDLGLETELYHITVSGNVTVSVSNAPTTARVVKRLIVQYSSGVLTWPASFRLPTPMPAFAAGKAYIFSIEQSPNSGVYFLVPGPEYTYP